MIRYTIITYDKTIDIDFYESGTLFSDAKFIFYISLSLQLDRSLSYIYGGSDSYLNRKKLNIPVVREEYD